MKIASEQNQPQPIPEKLPTEREVGEMLSNIELMKRSLEQVRETIQVSIQNEQAREGAKAKAPGEEDQDLPMYGDGLKAQYPMNEVKKRRGVRLPDLCFCGQKRLTCCTEGCTTWPMPQLQQDGHA